MGEWYVYILRCADDTLYTGIARDVAARLARHNAGTGARYTRARRPVELVYHEQVGNRSFALRREWTIKRLTAAKKRELIDTAPQEA